MLFNSVVNSPSLLYLAVRTICHRRSLSFSLLCLFQLARAPHLQFFFDLTSYSLDFFSDSCFFFPEQAQCLFLFYSLSVFILLIISNKFMALNTIYMLITPNLYLKPEPSPELQTCIINILLFNSIISCNV